MRIRWESYAICIKDGWMNSSGKQFCFKGKIYPYEYWQDCPGDYPYDVRTEGHFKCCHSMSTEFFHRHFKKITENNFITKEEMTL